MTTIRAILTVFDRVMIQARISDGLGVRAIARQLGRSAGVVCDEINRHGGRAAYQAQTAHARADASRRLCGRKSRLASGGILLDEIAALLRRGWSPEQISGRRKRIENGVVQDAKLLVSHEAIYSALYALPRGELRRELLACLRQNKPTRGRKPRGSELRGKLCNMTNIRERPEEVAGRLVPGHWEGDVILGARESSAVGTLVERTTRLVTLVRLPTRKADLTASAFSGALMKFPQALRKTLTYDQGKEMARHESLAQETGMRIYFADPHSPWQRGSNENTNGLLRQYLPRGMSLANITQEQLDEIAERLNNRPRKTLNYETPNERFKSLLASLTSQIQPSPTGVRSEI